MPRAQFPLRLGKCVIALASQLLRHAELQRHPHYRAVWAAVPAVWLTTPGGTFPVCWARRSRTPVPSGSGRRVVRPSIGGSGFFAPPPNSPPVRLLPSPTPVAEPPHPLFFLRSASVNICSAWRVTACESTAPPLSECCPESKPPPSPSPPAPSPTPAVPGDRSGTAAPACHQSTA